MHQTDMALGLFIKEHRESKNISKEELAATARLRENFIEQIEKGEIAHIADFIRLCCALGLSFERNHSEDYEPDKDKMMLSMLPELTEHEKEVLYIVMDRILESKGSLCRMSDSI